MNKNVNKTGYLKGTSTEKNPYNIIDSNKITMKGVDKNLLAIKLDSEGNPIGFEFMEKGKEYNFKDTSSVVEVPQYQLGTQFNLPNLPQNTGFQPQTPSLATQPFLNNNVGVERRLEQNPLTLPNISGVTNINPNISGELTNTASNAITGLEENPVEQELDQLELRKRNQVQFFNPYAGVDIPTSAVALGQSISNKDTLGTVGAGAKLGLGLARNIVGGLGLQNRENQVRENYQFQQRQGMRNPRFIGQEGGSLTEQDINNLRQNERINQFDDSIINSLFERTPEDQTVAPLANVDLGKYAAANYFDIIDQNQDRITLRNTARNPHNRESIDPIIQKIQKLNPNRTVELDFFQQGGQQEIIDSLDLSFLQAPQTNQQVEPQAFNEGKYDGLNYFDVVSRDNNNITISNTNQNPQNASSIAQQIKFLKKQNPKMNINFKYRPKYQDGGTIDQIFEDFNFEQEIGTLLAENNAPNGQLNLNKYDGLGYFDVNQDKSGNYNITNTDRNPQNANGFKDQLRQIREQNPDVKINSKYLPNFKKGGEVTEEQLLTGEALTGVSESNEDITNAEVEAGEYIKTNQGDIAEVVGKKHSQGGEKILMEMGDKVLTDHTKLGAENAKLIKEKFDLKVKSSNSFSNVLDKFRSKMGLNKLVDKEEKLLKRLEEENDTEDSQTKSLNVDFLTSEIQKINREKEPIEEARKILFDELFAIQESGKPKQEQSDSFQEGGEKQPQDQVVVAENPFNTPEDFVHQSNTKGIYFGKADMQRLNILERNFPLLVEQSFDIKKDELGDIISVDLKEGQTVENFQRAVDSNYEALIKDAERLGDPDRVKAFVDQVTNERFNTQVARGFDNKFGNFTSSRPNFGFRSVTPEDLKKLNDSGISTYKQLLDNEGNIRADLDLSDNSKKLLERFKGAESNFILGDKDVISNTPSETPEPKTQIGTVNNTVDRNGMAFALLPDQYPLLPDALEPSLKNTRRFDRIAPETIDVDPFLEELFSQQQTATQKLEGLPPSVRAAAEANISANTQKALSDTMLRVEQANLQQRSQANLFNAQTQRAEENARASDALNFEQRSQRASAINDLNMQNFFNKNQEVNALNFREINNLNLSNALNDDVQYNGNGTFSVSETPNFQAQIDALKAKQGLK